MGLRFGILQQALIESISIYPPNVYADEMGGVTSTEVTSSGTWSHDASDVPLWIFITTGSGSTGEEFLFEILENNGGTRNCTIKIWLDANHSVYDSLYIEQAGTI